MCVSGGGAETRIPNRIHEDSPHGSEQSPPEAEARRVLQPGHQQPESRHQEHLHEVREHGLAGIQDFPGRRTGLGKSVRPAILSTIFDHQKRSSSRLSNGTGFRTKTRSRILRRAAAAASSSSSVEGKYLRIPLRSRFAEQRKACVRTNRWHRRKGKWESSGPVE